ncbi:11-beta-hydroxysteroid dehydrogenase-like 4A [Arachis stenosperma]|uniref:11-beta-hydroxysteroid dehydrogenase-like 4A n=1 Tax=Arachis stenosperma TaxID=217475 RepID=UPI0025AC3C51|nr:11-beta-hydroxysteroid dehydrogenase-like 4A [Arachis stenosperma]
MAATQRLLNIALPPLSLVLLSSFMIPFLIFKVFIYVRNLFQTDEKLENKVVLITGAASGIGEQLAYEYGRRGAVLSLVDIREDNLVVVAEKARSLGSPDVIIIAADVSKLQDCRRFVDQTVNHFGRLDCLVNNAGIGKPSGFKDWSNASEFTPVMDVNFWGSVYGTLCAIPHLKTSRGRIIVIASVFGWFPLPRSSIYSASKAAVINYFETLRMELGRAISITIVTPGLINTGLGLTVVKERSIMGIFPMLSASELAKSIVKSACRGDMYLTEPSWVKVLFPFKLLYPQIVDSAVRFLIGLSRKRNDSATELKLE